MGSDLPPSKTPGMRNNNCLFFAHKVVVVLGVKNLTKMSDKYRAIFERMDKFVGYDPITGLIKPKPKYIESFFHTRLANLIFCFIRFEDMCEDSDTSSSPSVPTQDSSSNWPDLEIECC